MYPVGYEQPYVNIYWDTLSLQNTVSKSFLNNYFYILGK